MGEEVDSLLIGLPDLKDLLGRKEGGGERRSIFAFEGEDEVVFEGYAIGLGLFALAGKVSEA